MTETRKKPQGPATPEASLKGQVIVSMIALGIVLLGGWTLMGQQASYHPQIPPEDVSRGDVSSLSQVDTGIEIPGDS